MADVKIPISADTKGVGAEMKQVEKAVDGVGKATEKLQRVKWAPFDLKQAERDLRQYEKLAIETQRRIAQAAQQASGGAGGVPAAPSTPQPGGALVPVRRGGRGSRTYAPDILDVPSHLVSGVGGGFGTLSSYGMRGARAGAAGGGGLAGGAMGLLKGLGIGALAYGAFKIGQGVSEGHEMAKERAGTLDALKRQMGDVGISFERLKMVSEGVADGMQLNSKEAAELAKEFNRLSRSTGGPEGLREGTRTAVGVSRAYGLDPSMGVQFFAGMSNINPRQNNKELAVLIAEAVEKAGGRAKADDVMHAMQAFTETTARMSLSAPNLAAYGGAYTQMVSSGIPGLTSDTATGILSQANASMMRMGGAGEAGRNFMMAALQRHGGLNPIMAEILSEGGLFGTRRQVFGSGAIGSYFGASGLSTGAGADVTNFQAVKEHIEGSGLGKEMQLNMAKRMFGLSSYAQTASLMSLSGDQLGGLQALLDKSGVSLKDVNATGLQALAKLGPDASPDVVRQLAKANREETEWTKMQDSLKNLEDIKINTGDKLVPLTTDIKGLISDLVGGIPFLRSPYRQQMLDKEKGTGWGDGTGATGSWGSPSSSDTLFDKLLQQESGKRHMLGGKLIESKKGALGISQVMPATGADPGFGITPLQNQSEAEYRRFGRDYLDAMLKRYGGDKAKALAAYNAGPGAVDQAIAKGGSNWSGYMPAETISYISSIMGTSATPLPANATTNSAAQSSTNVNVNVSGEIRAPGGQVITPEVTTSVAVPRGAGVRSAYAAR